MLIEDNKEQIIQKKMQYMEKLFGKSQFESANQASDLEKAIL